jgi:phage terminase Nu1 subunit (DNA packaging protein)
LLFNATASSQLSPIKNRYQELEKIGKKITTNIKSSIARSVDNYAFYLLSFSNFKKC